MSCSITYYRYIVTCTKIRFNVIILCNSDNDVDMDMDDNNNNQRRAMKYTNSQIIEVINIKPESPKAFDLKLM